MSVVAIDLDGVLSDFNTAAYRLVFGREPQDVPFMPPEWDWVKGAEARMLWKKIEGFYNFWLHLPAYPDNIVALARWLIQRVDQDVHFVTSRVPTAGMSVARQSEFWLQSCGIRPGQNYLGVVVVPDSDEKKYIYKAMGVEYSIDDRTETVEQCDSLPGHQAFLLDRPWNQDAGVKRRATTLLGFLEKIK